MKNKIIWLIGFTFLSILFSFCTEKDVGGFNQPLNNKNKQAQAATTLNKTNNEDILSIASNGIWDCAEYGGKQRDSFSNDFLEAVERRDLVGKPSSPYYMTIDGKKGIGKLKIHGEPKYYDLIITKISDGEIQIQYPSGIKRKAKIIREKTIEGKWLNPEMYFEYSPKDPKGDESLVQLYNGFNSIEEADQFKTDSDNSPPDIESSNNVDGSAK